VVVRISVPERARAEEHLADAPGGVLLFTDGYPSLTPGYWSVVIGPYASGADAVARCRADGLTDRNSCFGAYLSNNPADRDQRAYPD
jgi:hypothetical protein